jgi:hypothetical protein
MVGGQVFCFGGDIFVGVVAAKTPALVGVVGVNDMHKGLVIFKGTPVKSLAIIPGLVCLAIFICASGIIIGFGIAGNLAFFIGPLGGVVTQVLKYFGVVFY